MKGHTQGGAFSGQESQGGGEILCTSLAHAVSYDVLAGGAARHPFLPSHQNCCQGLKMRYENWQGLGFNLSQPEQPQHPVFISKFQGARGAAKGMANLLRGTKGSSWGWAGLGWADSPVFCRMGMEAAGLSGWT